jgi:hypothetical protein
MLAHSRLGLRKATDAGMLPHSRAGHAGGIDTLLRTGKP